jgi:Na+/H+ antiporter NhaC
MRLPNQSAAGGVSASLASPALVVILVLLIGATVYLWRARYLRPSTAYYTLGFFTIALIVIGALMYTSRV